MRLYRYTIMRRLFLCALTSGLLPSTHSRHSMSGGCLDSGTSACTPKLSSLTSTLSFKPLATTDVGDV